MDAIRSLAAEHGLAALEGLADYGAHHALMPGREPVDPRLPRAYGRGAAGRSGRCRARPRSDPRRAGAAAPLGHSTARPSIEAQCAPSRSCSTTSSTRARATAKLRLIGDYLKATPDPDRGIALAALTGTLDIPAVKPAAVRALAEERIDPVLLRMSRDYVGDMAETVSLLWPASAEGCAEIDDGTVRIVGRGRAASAGEQDAMRRGCSPRCSTISMSSGRFALLKLATGALRVGISARLAKQALADAFGLDVEAVEEVWHGLKPPYRRAVRLGRGPRRSSRPAATCRCSARSCSPIRSRTRESTSTTMRPSGNGTGSASSWSTPAARPGSTAAPATTFRPASPTSPRRSPSARCSTASCWCAARRRAPTSMAARRRASTRSSSGSAARPSAPRCRAQYPAFVRLYDMLFDGEEDLRGLAVERAARAARGVRRPARPRAVRPVAR